MLKILLLVATAAAAAESERVFTIPQSNPEAIFEPICLSSIDPDTHYVAVLETEGDYRFRPRAAAQKMFPAGGCFLYQILTPGLSLGDVRGSVEIVGNGSRVRGLTLLVEESGTLDIRDLNFDLQNNQLPGVINRGTARMSRSSLTRAGQNLSPAMPALVLFNEADMTLTNVSIASNGLFDREPCRPGFSTVVNSGQLRLHHVSMDGNRPGGCEALHLYNEGQVTVSNSAITNAGIGFSCAGPGNIQSLGYNYQNFAPCTDALLETDLNPRNNQNRPGAVRFGRFGRALQLGPNHPSVGLIPGARCEALDQFGSPRQRSSCMPGAIEAGAPVAMVPRTLTGLWFDPTADGQYLQFLYPRQGEVLMTWQTFDQDGHPLWLYGQGRPTANRVELRLYRNEGLRFRNGQFDGVIAAEQVGGATFEIFDCERARFEFDSPLLAGQGQYRKLAFAEGLKCGGQPLD